MTGITCILASGVSYLKSKKAQLTAIEQYKTALSQASSQEKLALLNNALRYNQQLFSANIPLLSYEPLQGYTNVLNLNDDGVMGYIVIPKTNTKLPIYHNSSDDVLDKGMGHVESSCLPVGGNSSHCLLAAHRKFLKNLDKIEVGDVFILNVAGNSFKYTVDKIDIVKPDETDEIIIEENKDYCTLITCHPDGVNTHRLLVRGVRDNSVEFNIRSWMLY